MQAKNDSHFQEKIKRQPCCIAADFSKYVYFIIDLPVRCQKTEVACKQKPAHPQHYYTNI